jgi:hypothetical protein
LPRPRSRAELFRLPRYLELRTHLLQLLGHGKSTDLGNLAVTNETHSLPLGIALDAGE